MRALPDPSLCVVTDPDAPAGVEAVALAAARGGARMIQLRDKSRGDAELVKLARGLRRALAPFGAKLIVNDRVEVAAAAGADGAHVGQGDMPVAQARARLGPDAILGLSIESEGQLAGVDWAAVDYVGAGPVFATSTKPDAAPATGWDGLAAICAGAPAPCLAIGGLRAAHAGRAKAAGAAGLAVVSAVCAARDPEAATRELIEAWRAAE
jgi:thiamine-phosphate pyrophosphorylase